MLCLESYVLEKLQELDHIFLATGPGSNLGVGYFLKKSTCI